MKKNLAIISIGLSLYMTTQCINTLNASHDKNSNIIEEALKLGCNRQILMLQKKLSSLQKA